MLSVGQMSELTDEQCRAIGEFVEANHMTHCVGAIVLKQHHVPKNQVLSPKEQEDILWHAGVLGDVRIANRVLGSDEPQCSINVMTFMRELLSAMRQFSKETLRNGILQKTSGAKVVCFRNRSGGRLVVHRAVRKDATSDWQLTTIASDGIPSGHNNPPSFNEALFRAIGASEDSYWNEHGYEYEWSDNTGYPPPA